MKASLKKILLLQLISVAQHLDYGEKKEPAEAFAKMEICIMQLIEILI